MYADSVILDEALDVEEVFGVVLLVPGFDDDICITVGVYVSGDLFVDRHPRVNDKPRSYINAARA